MAEPLQDYRFEPRPELQKTLQLVTCRSNDASVQRKTRWAQEVDAALTVFATELKLQGIYLNRLRLPPEQCPEQVKDGCYTISGKVYCSDDALERLVFSLALLLSKVQSHPSVYLLTPPPGSVREETMLDLLGRDPYVGYRSTIVVDRVMFPNWWESYAIRFSSFPAKNEATPWIRAAKSLHEQEGDTLYRQARDLLIAFIVGHESFHALRRCPVQTTSFPERSGYLESLVASQQYGYGCPDPPSNVEVNADACGARWLERIDTRAGKQKIDLMSEKVARSATMLILQSVFAQGLSAPPRRELDWQPTGYLFGHLRTALVHRTFFPLNGRDPRIGLCHDALMFLWDMQQRSTVCVAGNDVELLAKRADGRFFDILPSVDVVSRTPGRKESCLSGSNELHLNLAAPTRGDPKVRVHVLTLRPERKNSFVQSAAGSVQLMLNRPYIYAGLSACLPADIRTLTLDLRYTHEGKLDEVRGTAHVTVRDCVKDALADLVFATNLDTAFRSPDVPYIPPGYVMVLELKRSE